MIVKQRKMHAKVKPRVKGMALQQCQQKTVLMQVVLKEHNVS
jgi:hypothetical protein